MNQSLPASENRIVSPAATVASPIPTNPELENDAAPIPDRNANPVPQTRLEEEVARLDFVEPGDDRRHPSNSVPYDRGAHRIYRRPNIPQGTSFPRLHEPAPDHKQRQEDDLHPQDDIRKSNNVNQFFEDRKFTGDIMQSMDFYLRDYHVCYRQYKLTRQQKADYFVNILDGPAQTFFFNNVDDNMPFESMAKLMMNEYNSDARQQQVKGKLDTLCLHSYMAEHEITSTTEGLSSMANFIEDLLPQCPPYTRSEGNKIEILRKAVLQFECSKSAVQSIVSSGYTFNRFVTALNEGIQLQNEMELLNKSSIEHDTLYQQYGRHPNHVKNNRPAFSERPKNKPRAPYNRSFEEARQRNECYKCGDHWPRGHRYGAGAIRDTIRDRLRNGHQSVHIIHDLVSELEKDYDEDEDSGEGLELPPDETNHVQIDDLQLFDSLSNTASDSHQHYITEAEKEWFTHNISASMSTNKKDFRRGDEK